MAELGIKYVSEAANTGYGRAARGYLRALSQSGVGLTWTPMVPGRRWGMYLEPFEGRNPDHEFGSLCNLPTAYDVVMVHSIAPYFRSWRAREPGKKLIGVTVWEGERLPDGELCELQVADGLIVPCHWNAEVFRKGGVTCPIHVAPHVHIESPDEPRPLEIDGVGSGDFVFYSIGDWKDRKGMHLTLEAFCRAFSSCDPVVLVIKTGRSNERIGRQRFRWRNLLQRPCTSLHEIGRIRKRHRDPPRVVALTDELSDSEMRSLHARGDGYVSLTRAEGWGLGAYEAAFAANPVVITGYGGQLEYLPADLSSHIDFRLVEAEPLGEIDQRLRGMHWAEPDLDHAARLMRETFEHREEARARGRHLQAHVRACFASERIARGMIDFANSLR